ncbi:GNAT family N-acetyltransferase [Chitinophaga silvatica]|uniref:GNAT family N-acetyltransferase n=1 Tax=Chitinophaga silvatica TaxID=2282649 RepID=A0A3E1Y9P8_9BACT|nr:GNAT family N-acetyltransferase [Chitinophaga silvatica]RFS21916.1 GNAT family N-acetyltransferase [Chitinophaga silvatica]
MQGTIVGNESELLQIAALSSANNIKTLTAEEKAKDGFVTWSYDFEVLQQLHQITPSIIVKDGDLVVGYALVLPPDAATVYPPLATMLNHVGSLEYNNRPVSSYNYYVMGQVCVHPDYRGKGVFQLLYQQHKNIYSQQYELLVTEISTSNHRSQRAHSKVGFKSIHTYKDELGEWDVVIWNWELPK